MAKISVIIPVYNTEKYLRFCLDSIRRQTLDDIEVIVVDDGSNDSSPAICDDFAHDKRFQIFHNANKGVSKARNFGIERATGKYCMFVDSDDWLDETMCETMLKSAEKTMRIWLFVEIIMRPPQVLPKDVCIRKAHYL